jgi:probable rRNA maturation factor
MIEVEVFGASLAPEAPPPDELRRLCTLAAARMGIHEAHVAIEFVDVGRMAQLNAEHRSRPGPTDVLSFPIDGVGPAGGAAALPDRGPHDPSAQMVPRELGDIIICPQRTADLREAIVHGMLHLLGMDHETDDGDMLALQRELLAGAGG